MSAVGSDVERPLEECGVVGDVAGVPLAARLEAQGGELTRLVLKQRQRARGVGVVAGRFGPVVAGTQFPLPRELVDRGAEPAGVAVRARARALLGEYLGLHHQRAVDAAPRILPAVEKVA